MEVTSHTFLPRLPVRPPARCAWAGVRTQTGPKDRQAADRSPTLRGYSQENSWCQYKQRADSPKANLRFPPPSKLRRESRRTQDIREQQFSFNLNVPCAIAGSSVSRQAAEIAETSIILTRVTNYQGYGVPLNHFLEREKLNHYSCSSCMRQLSGGRGTLRM